MLACAWFLEIACLHVGMLVCVPLSVCLPPRALITSGVILYDMHSA